MGGSGKDLIRLFGIQQSRLRSKSVRKKFEGSYLPLHYCFNQFIGDPELVRLKIVQKKFVSFFGKFSRFVAVAGAAKNPG